MTYYPIIIPTLNRYSHFKRCVESLIACTHADKTELVIGLDYPPSEKYIDGWKKIKDYIPSITGFQKVTVFYREHNYGAAKNSTDLHNYVFETYDAFIFTEDDNIFSPCFLDYINKGLEKYRDDYSIAAICGYWNDYWLPSQNHDSTIFKLEGFFSAWGYGTWNNRFDNFRKHFPKDFKKQIFDDKRFLLKLIFHIEHLNNNFYWLENKELNRPCDFTMATFMLKNKMKSIFPLLSLVRNNGYDGSGINCGIDNNQLCNQKISQENIFNLSDALTDKIDRKNVKSYEYINSKHYSSSVKCSLYVHCILYLIFGYSMINKLEINFKKNKLLLKIKKIKLLFKRVIRKTKNLIKAILYKLGVIK